MITNGDFEERLATLEKQVAELRQAQQQQKDNDWPDRLFGRMKDFSEWPEISRVGKELGNAQSDHTD